MAMLHLYGAILVWSVYIYLSCHAVSLPWNAMTLEYKVTNILPVQNLDTYLFRAKSCDKMVVQVFWQWVTVYQVDMIGSTQTGTGPITEVTLNDLSGTLVDHTALTNTEAHIECDIFKSFYVHWSGGVFLFGSGSVPHQHILSSMDLGATNTYSYMEMKADKSDASVVAEVKWLPGFINGIFSIPRIAFTPEQDVTLYDYSDTCIQFSGEVLSTSSSVIIDFGVPFYLSGIEFSIIAVVGPHTLCSTDVSRSDDENLVSLYIAHDETDGCDSKSLHQCSFTGEGSLMDQRSCRYSCTCVGNTCTSGMIHVKRTNSNLQICELLVGSTF